MANDFRAQTSYLRGVLMAGFLEEMDLLKTCKYDLSSDMNGAKSMTIRGVTAVSLAEYTGADLTASRATAVSDTLTLDKWYAASERVQRGDYENDQQMKEILNNIAVGIVRQTKQLVNTEICDQYSSATAIAADSTPEVLTPTNVWVKLNKFVVRFNQNNIPVENRVIVVPPAVGGLMADVRNLKGISGAIDARIIVSNQISSTTVGDETIYRVFGYTSDWLLAGLGIDDVAMGDIGELNFGHFIKALILFGVTPATNVIGTLGWYMSSQVDDSLIV